MATHDLYREFSNEMAGRIARGDLPWAAEQDGAQRPRPVKLSGEPYGGVSVLAQWAAAKERDYDSPVWLSQAIIEDLGGRAAAGAKPVDAWVSGVRPVRAPSPETGDMMVRSARVWRSHAVWNVADVEGVTGLPEARALRFAPDDVEGGQRLHALASAAGADWMTMKGRSNFQDACARLIRWTGHPARLNRRCEAAEESLVAEIGGAFLAADLRLPAHAGERSDGAEGWSRLLVADDLAIFRSAREATRAVEFIHLRVPGYRAAVTVPIERRPAPKAAETEPVSAASARDAEIEAIQAGLAARQEAKAFVQAAEAHRRADAGGEAHAREARRLLGAADRIDLGIEGVDDAVRAEAFLHGVMSVSRGADYLAEFRREAEERLQARQGAETVRQPDMAFRGPRL